MSSVAPTESRSSERLREQLARLARLDSGHPDSQRIQDDILRQLCPAEHDVPFVANLSVAGQHLRLHRLAGMLNLSVESAQGYAEFQLAEGHEAAPTLRRLMRDLSGAPTGGVQRHQVGQADALLPVRVEPPSLSVELHWPGSAGTRAPGGAIPEGVTPVPDRSLNQQARADQAQRRRDAQKTQITPRLHLTRTQVQELALGGMNGNVPSVATTTQILGDLLALRGTGHEAEQIVSTQRARELARNSRGGTPLHPEQIQLCLIDLCDLHASMCEDRPAPALTAPAV